MRNKTCCFTGHRQIGNNESEIRSKLKNELIKLINKGVIYFGTGGALGFDTIAAETIIELKKNFPHIKLILVIPCANQTELWSNKDIEKYNLIKCQADKIKILSPYYYDGCMLARNRHMVDCSSTLICYIRKNSGGTYYTLNYAQKKGLNIIKI